MKFQRNSRYFTIAVYALVTTLLAALGIMLIFDRNAVFSKLSVFTGVLSPIIIGIFCAYLMNPLMVKLEDGLFGKMKNSDNPKGRGKARVLALTLTMVIVLAFITLVIILIIPQLVDNIIAIFSNMDKYIEEVHKWIDDISKENPQIGEFLGNPLDDLGSLMTGIWEQYSEELLSFAGNVASGLWDVFNVLSNVFVGLILSIYILARKEMFIGQSKKILFAFVKPARAQRFLNVCRSASEKFLGSIVGKILEAVLVAVIYFVAFAIVQMPYGPLLSAIMFVFNLIPFIGPAIGCIPCCLILLIADYPFMCLWFLIFALILQMVDGNIIAPIVLGDKTGLPAVWILAAIIVGGGLYGMMGMFLGVPVCAVIYMLVKDFIENRLKKRKLPSKTADYVGNVDYITPEFVYEEPETPPVPVEEKPKKPTIIDKIKAKIEKSKAKKAEKNSGKTPKKRQNTGNSKKNKK